MLLGIPKMLLAIPKRLLGIPNMLLGILKRPLGITKKLLGIPNLFLCIPKRNQQGHLRAWLRGDLGQMGIRGDQFSTEVRTPKASFNRGIRSINMTSKYDIKK